MERHRLIPLNQSVIIAADVSLDKFIALVHATADVPGISGYKVGFSLGLRYSLPQVVEAVRKNDKTGRTRIIYDHQKAANDVPDLGSEFASVCSDAGVDAVILFPHAGPTTQTAWTKAAQDKGLHVLLGLHMTHPQYLNSEGGYVNDRAPRRALELAASMGVSDFVLPGNKVKFVKSYRRLLDKTLGFGNFDVYAPGFIAQGGQISEYALEAGPLWHAIVGRGITLPPDMRAAAELNTVQFK